jgi:hypothetical protein
MENAFWIHFEHFGLNSSAAGKPAVIARGTSSGPNVRVPSQITFIKGTFSFGGVLYQQNVNEINVGAHNWHFQDVVLENSSTALLEITEQSASWLESFQGLFMSNIEVADAGLGTIPIIKKNFIRSLRGVTMLSIQGPGSRAIQSNNDVVYGVLINAGPNSGMWVTDNSGNATGEVTIHKGSGWIIAANTGNDVYTDMFQGAGPAIKAGRYDEANASVGLSASANNGLMFGPGAGTGGWDTTLYRNGVGQLKTDTQLQALKGITTMVKAGTPVDGDFATTPPVGTIVVDTTANKIWVRTGAATWKGVVVA